MPCDSSPGYVLTPASVAATLTDYFCVFNAVVTSILDSPSTSWVEWTVSNRCGWKANNNMASILRSNGTLSSQHTQKSVPWIGLSNILFSCLWACIWGRLWKEFLFFAACGISCISHWRWCTHQITDWHWMCAKVSVGPRSVVVQAPLYNRCLHG